jgi:tetratricopeptide (TPR) repeat protein
MSYINQALKKAQKDKDAGRIGYIRSIGGTGSGAGRLYGRQYLYAALALIILVSGGIFYLVRVNAGRAPEVVEKPSAIENGTGIRQGRDISVQKKAGSGKIDAALPDTGRKAMTDAVEYLYKKASILLKEKRVKEALAIYMEILDKDPGHFASLNDIGVLYLQDGRYISAINNLEKAVRLNPRFVTPCYNLACAYALNNEPEKAMFYLEKAIGINKEVKAWAKNDPDLKNLRGQSGFVALIE